MCIRDRVDDQRADAQGRDLDDQLVDLQRQEQRGGDHRDVLAPPLHQPQADALDDVEAGVEPDAQGSQANGRRRQRQRLLDPVHGVQVLDADSQLGTQRTQQREVRVEGLPHRVLVAVELEAVSSTLLGVHKRHVGRQRRKAGPDGL